MTAGVRSALCRAPPGPLCCQWAELAAMVRLAGGLRVTNSGTLSVVTELPTAQAAERLCTTAHAHTTAQVTVLVHPTADRRCTVAITPGRDLAMRSGLLDRRGRPVLGLPPAVLQGGRCDAAAVWRGALLATAEAPNPGRRRHGLAVPCPNTLVAVALVGLARRLGAAAHVSTHHGREHTHLTDPTAIATLLTAAGGPAAATAWHHHHPTPRHHRRRPPTRLRRSQQSPGPRRRHPRRRPDHPRLHHPGPRHHPGTAAPGWATPPRPPRTVHRRARRADRPATDQRHPRRPPPAVAGPRQPDLNPARHMTISPRSTPVW